MANITEVKKVELPEEKKIASLNTAINQSIKDLQRALPNGMSANRLARIALTTIRKNPKLADTNTQSFLGALFQSAQLGLEPDVNGECYILPFNNYNSKTKQWSLDAQFVIGYKGLVQLFYRAGKGALQIQTVYKGDIFEYQLGTEEYIKHIPQGKSNESIAYYAVAKINGEKVFKVMTKEQVLEHASHHSKSFNKKEGDFMASSPWATSFDQMAMKTVLIQLMKTMPLSPQLQKAIQADETVKINISDDMAMEEDKTNWNDIEVKATPVIQEVNNEIAKV